MDVLPTGEFGIEAASKLQQRGDSALDLNFSLRRRERAGDQLEERALARSVAADDAEPLAGPHIERDVSERPEVLSVVASQSREEHLLQTILRLSVDAIQLANVANADRGGIGGRSRRCHRTSPKLRRVRMNHA